ncbi:ABC transporter substrate-binding protein [Paenibacillus solisilvae]|uniref:ABC transporter substrate-binding protein n=1 Tax=Paenibacillus solisilvae TaxID=2486751 RepID=A0ABW0W9D2_9BACL
MLKKWNLMLASIVALSLLLAACSSSNSSSNGAASNTGTEEAGGKPGGTVEYWSMFSEGEPLQLWLADAFKQFETETGIKVNPTWAGRDVITKLRSNLLAGKVPDLIEQSNSELTAGLVSNELAAPLDDYLATSAYDSDQKWMDTFIPNVMKQMQYTDSKTYVIPRDTYTSGFFYSAALFKKLGLQPPTTWEEFLKVCEALKKQGIAPIAADGNIQFYNFWYFSWLAMREVGPDKLYAAAGDKTGEAWRDPGFLEAAKKLRYLIDQEYFAQGYEGSAYPSGQVNWVNGKAGMILNGAWLPSELAKQTPDGFDMQMFKFPDLGAYDGTTAEVWVNGWLLLKDAKNKDAAVQLLKFLTSKQQMDKVAQLGTPVSTLQSVTPKALTAQTEIFNTASKVIPKWGGLEKDFAELNKRVLWAVDDQLFFGKLTPEQFIEQTVKQQKAFYANK